MSGEKENKRRFNVTGLCVPEQDYMCDISDKVSQTVAMVERGDYFTINRARQYGKTTLQWQLEQTLVKKGYLVAGISFEGIGDTPFENEANFCKSILSLIARAIKNYNASEAELWQNSYTETFDELSEILNTLCKDKKIVLTIDETDKTSNNFIFLRFLGILRDKYLNRKKFGYTFQSVILIGVYDIKNLKSKMIQAGTHQLQDGEKRINSPWNIAADFKIDMSFSASNISTMLLEYEKDCKTGMDIEAISKEIRAYTNGYPYLVSRLCKIIDEDLNKDWTLNGLQEAVKLILIEQSTLFDDLIKNVENNDELNSLLKRGILGGERIPFNPDNYAIRTGLIFGIFLQKNEYVSIHNEIFELRLYNYYISLKETGKIDVPRTLPAYVMEGNKFNMALAIKKFMAHYYELYHKSNESFLEKECRLLFLTFLKPLINGNGFYHIESETRNRERTDVIVDFNDQQFIVELKLWKGEASHEKALEQIAGYLDSKNKDIGYLLTFDFRKRDNVGKPKAEWVEHKGKRIFDCMVGIL
ncbi:MAG: AAA-like domain-containing protein [Fibromonadales bacterium]|nr:AAA-like domain-containing protein [Fibromonadales bacterium]